MGVRVDAATKYHIRFGVPVGVFVMVDVGVLVVVRSGVSDGGCVTGDWVADGVGVGPQQLSGGAGGGAQVAT